MTLLLQYLHQQAQRQFEGHCCAAAQQGGGSPGPEQAGAGAAQQGEVTRTLYLHSLAFLAGTAEGPSVCSHSRRQELSPLTVSLLKSRY